MLQRFRDWLLRIPVLSVCAMGVVASALFGLSLDRAGENKVLVEPPLFGLWLVTWILILAHAHRAFARSRNSLVRFGAPIAAAVVFVISTGYAGQFIANWLSSGAFPHQRVLP